MKVTIAYIEEPPFGWTEPDSTPTGADIDLADAVLRAIGVARIEHHLTSFSELLPGVEAGRWDMNVPLFVTRERANMVAFASRYGGSQTVFWFGLETRKRSTATCRLPNALMRALAS